MTAEIIDYFGGIIRTIKRQFKPKQYRIFGKWFPNDGT